MHVLPKNEWKVLVYWYSHLSVYVKWGGYQSSAIKIEKGTRQGGLSSPLIFNILYNGLMDILSECDNGVTIKGTHYNVYSYADDILLSSASITGLQKLIDIASSYIQKMGYSLTILKLHV